MGYYIGKPIREWAVEDRPREKLLSKGIASLTDAELLAILLSSGTRELSAIDLSRKIIAEFGGTHKLARASALDLMKIRGIGKAKAMIIVSAYELGRRKMGHEHRILKISSSEQVANYLIPKLGDLSNEVFHVLFLNQNNEIQGEKTIHSGGVTQTIIDPKMVFREALRHLAPSIIIAHNHPSGSLRPSAADENITRQLKSAAEMLDIKILDHLIISEKGYYSFADHGMI